MASEEPANVVCVVMGVTASGKTTFGRLLAEVMNEELKGPRAVFVDADAHHDDASRAKMSAGVALTDDDRAAWLERLRGAIDEWVSSGNNDGEQKVFILACSALKEKYRRVLFSPPPPVGSGAAQQDLPSHSQSPKIRYKLVYLDVSQETATARATDRGDSHFVSPAIVASQFEALEVPTAEEALRGGFDLWVDSSGVGECVEELFLKILTST